jgi:hypothetical protein
VVSREEKPRNWWFPNAQGVVVPEGSSDVGAERQVGGAFGGVVERGASTEGGPVTWEGSCSSLESRRNGEPDHNLRRAAGLGAPAAGPEEAPAKGGPHCEGQPKRRPTSTSSRRAQ